MWILGGGKGSVWREKREYDDDNETHHIYEHLQWRIDLVKCLYTWQAIASARAISDPLFFSLLVRRLYKRDNIAMKKPSSNRTLSHSHLRNVYMCACDRASVCVCAFVWVVARSKWVVKLVYHVYYCWHFLYFYLDSRAANPSSQLCNITFARKHHQHIDEFQLHLNVSQIFLFRVLHIEIMM